MKAVILILGLLAIAAASTDIYQEAQRIWKLQTGGQPWPGASMAAPLASDTDFEDYMTMYSKKYTTEAERQVRFQNFQVNQILAQAFQATEKGSAKYGVTKFSDLSYDEFKRFYRNVDTTQLKSPTLQARIPRIQAPASVDWRTKNAVTYVKNQGQCGSCWTFSATGNMEGQWAIKKGQLLSLSEQQLLDCDRTSNGCNGGWPIRAMEYVHEAGGIELNADYQYDQRQGSCRANPSEYKVYVNATTKIPSNEAEMATWCAANGPISIFVNAGTMQYYQGGIAYHTASQCNPNDLDHCILIVGYGTTNNEPYWIVKNSWGADWGEQGYWMVSRGYNVCGLANEPTSAVIY